MGVKRLTRLHARGMEQVVDADSDELFNWPWIYMEHGNGWNLTEDEVVRLRQYLLRGGFLFPTTRTEITNGNPCSRACR